MYTGIYKIAGHTVEITSCFEEVHRLCGDYRWDGPAEFAAAVSQADIAYERERSAAEDEKEEIPVRQFPDAYLETLAVYRRIADRMIEYDTLLFHGSAVAVDGAAYLFTAKSGTGKSTHTRLWRQVFGDRAMMVNDDKPLLRVTEAGVWVCGTPWDGKHRLSTNTVVPLHGICILERGTENRIRSVPAKEALPMLLQQSHRPADPAALTRMLALVDRLTKKMDFYRLECNMDPEAAQVAYEGMHRKDV